MAFKHSLGIQVDRGTDPHQNATREYFTVAPTGSMVLLTGLLGYVTGAVGANATTVSWRLDPIVAAGANSPLCAGLNIINGTIGDVLTITGLPANPMIYAILASAEMFALAGKGIVLAAGRLDFVCSAAFGASRWTLWYIPIDAGATIVATAPP